MKKLFALLAVAGLSASAYAADGKGTEFKFGGSMSQTFNWNDNVNFQPGSGVNGAGVVPLHESHWLQKNNFHVSAMTSDKMMAYMNFYNAGIWGASTFNAGSPYAALTTTTSGVPATAAIGYPSAISVSEAWMWWKASDMLSFKTGRQAFNLGSGFVVSKNEGAPMPYFFDAFMGRASWDFLDLDFGGAKLSDAGLPAFVTINTDMETVVYAVNAGIKSLPDMFKKFDIFAISMSGDASAAGSIAIPGITGATPWNLMNYGLYTKMDFAMVDLAINFVSQSGKQKGATDTTYSGMAYDVEVGVNLPEFMKARIAVDYHSSSGDDPTTTTTNEGYQPLFSDLEKYSVANIWNMGNLNNIKVGLSLSPSEETSFGAEYNMLGRSQAKAGAGMNLISTTTTNFGQVFNPGTGNATSTEAGVGSVIGVWAKHNYGHGFNIMAGLDMISLGNFYKPTGGTAPGSAMGVKLGANYNF